MVAAESHADISAPEPRHELAFIGPGVFRTGARQNGPLAIEHVPDHGPGAALKRFRRVGAVDGQPCVSVQIPNGQGRRPGEVRKRGRERLGGGVVRSPDHKQIVAHLKPP